MKKENRQLLGDIVENILLSLGLHVVISLQGLGQWLVLPMTFFSFLGTEQFFLVILPALYWCVDSGLGLRVGVILLLNTSVNDAAKLALHGPRPYWVSPQVKTYATETSFGAPSGHAQISAGVWGMLAATLRKRWAWWLAGSIVFLVGLSRLYLGVHFPHDVLLGWIIGGLLLWVVLRLWDPVAAWLANRRLIGQILMAFLASVFIILVELVPFLWLKLQGWVPPSAWAAYAGGAVSLSGAFTSGGAFFGLAAGLAGFKAQGGFIPTGPIGKRILRYVVGMLGLLVFYLGLELLSNRLTSGGEELPAYLLRYGRYALVGAWISFGAPWTFLRWRLADPA
jgi:membrane-associated phospholipid phosphatase